MVIQRAHRVVKNLRTTTGTDDFTVSGTTDVPVFAIVYVTTATTVILDADHRHFGCGMWDGTNDGVGIAESYEDGVTTSDSGRYSWDDNQALVVLDAAGDAVDISADFDSFIAGGVRLDVTSTNGTGVEVGIILFFGDDIEVEVGWENPGGTASGANKITTGFKPDLIFAGGNFTTFNETAAAVGLRGFGMATRDPDDDSVASQLGYVMDCTFGAANGEPRFMKTDQFMQVLRSASLTWASVGMATTNPFESDGFSIDTFASDTSGNTNSWSRIMWAAIKFADDTKFALSNTVSNGDSGGGVVDLKASFNPQMAMGWVCGQDDNSWVDETIDIGTTAAGMCAHFFLDADKDEALSVGGYTENGAATMVEQSYLTQDCLHLRDGSGNDVLNGNQTSIATTSSTIEFTSANDDDTYDIVFFALQREYQCNIDASFPAALAPAETEQVFELSGGPSISAMRINGNFFNTFPQGLHLVRIRPDMQPTSVEVEADWVEHAGDIAVTIGAATVEIEAELLLDADIGVLLPAALTDIDAEMLLDGEIAATLGAASASLVAALELDAVIEPTLPAMAPDLVAEQELSATIEPTLPAMQPDLVAAQDNDAVVEPTLPAMQPDLVAEQQLDSTIEVTLPAMTPDLVAAQELDAEITPTLPAISPELVGETDNDSTIEVALPAMQPTLIGELQFSAVIGPTLPIMVPEIVADGAATEGGIGVTLPAAEAELIAEFFEVEVAATAAPTSASIEAELLLDATLGVTLPGMLVDIQADELYDAQTSLLMPSMAVDLDAELDFSSIIEPTLPPMQVDLVAAIDTDAVINATLAPASATLTGVNGNIDAEIGAGLPAATVELEADREAFAEIGAATLPIMVPEIIVGGQYDVDIGATLAPASAGLVAEQIYEVVIGPSFAAAAAAIEAVTGDVDAVVNPTLPALTVDLDAELQLDAVIGVTLPMMTVKILDADLLGCTTDLIGSSDIITDLIGSKRLIVDLEGSQDTLTDLVGSSDIVVELEGSYDGLIDLDGSSC